MGGVRGQANITKKLVGEKVVIKMKNNHLWLLQNFSTGSGVKKNKTQFQHQCTALKNMALPLGTHPLCFHRDEETLHQKYNLIGWEGRGGNLAGSTVVLRQGGTACALGFLQ